MIQIIVKRNEQQPKITIDLSDVFSSYAARESFRLALQQDGFSDEFIEEVFNEKELEQLDK